MPQSNLLELTYFDPKAQVRLTTYADTIITEPNGREESIAAVRFGGYPEMVRTMSDAIYGGGTVDLIQNGNTFHLKSKPKSYQRHMSHDGTYATATLMIQDEALSAHSTDEDEDAASSAPEAGEKKTGKGRATKAAPGKTAKAPGKGKRAAPGKGAPLSPAKKEAPAPPTEPAPAP